MLKQGIKKSTILRVYQGQPASGLVCSFSTGNNGQVFPVEALFPEENQFDHSYTNRTEKRSTTLGIHAKYELYKVQKTNQWSKTLPRRMPRDHRAKTLFEGVKKRAQEKYGSSSNEAQENIHVDEQTGLAYGMKFDDFVNYKKGYTSSSQGPRSKASKDVDRYENLIRVLGVDLNPEFYASLDVDHIFKQESVDNMISKYVLRLAKQQAIDQKAFEIIEKTEQEALENGIALTTAEKEAIHQEIASAYTEFNPESAAVDKYYATKYVEDLIKNRENNRLRYHQELADYQVNTKEIPFKKEFFGNIVLNDEHEDPNYSSASDEYEDNVLADYNMKPRFDPLEDTVQLDLKENIKSKFDQDAIHEAEHPILEGLKSRDKTALEDLAPKERFLAMEERLNPDFSNINTTNAERLLKQSYYRRKKQFLGDLADGALDYEEPEEATIPQRAINQRDLARARHVKEVEKNYSSLRDQFLAEGDMPEIDEVVENLSAEIAKQPALVRRRLIEDALDSDPHFKARYLDQDHMNPDFVWESRFMENEFPKVTPRSFDDLTEVHFPDLGTYEGARKLQNEAFESTQEPTRDLIAEFQINSNLDEDPFFSHYLHNQFRYNMDYHHQAVGKSDLEPAITFRNQDLVDFDTEDLKSSLQTGKTDERKTSQRTTLNQVIAIGKRKTSGAMVALSEGFGKITINNRPFLHYFPRIYEREFIMRPLEVTATATRFDLKISVHGGGTSGQAGAIRMALARALARQNPDFKPFLDEEGFIKPDHRQVERKKPGRTKARKGWPYKKR